MKYYQFVTKSVQTVNLLFSKANDMKEFFKTTIAFCFILSASLTKAQDVEVSTVKDMLVSLWIFNIQSDNKPRLLRVSDIKKIGEKNFEVAATYGILSEKQGPIPGAMLALVDKGYLLTFTTQANSRIEAYFTPEKTFKGSFSPAKGAPQEILMSKATEQDVLAAQASTAARPPTAPTVAPHLRSYKTPDGYSLVPFAELTKLKSFQFTDAEGRGILIRLTQTDAKGKFSSIYGGYNFPGDWEVLEKDEKGASIDGRFNMAYLEADNKAPRPRLMVVDKDGVWYMHNPQERDPKKSFLKVDKKS